ncbi:hypothetical protein L7F22_005406 [Adiantum nelumboides]|nr:hypothetical protein [Adiantum nelumboides]
MYAMVATRPDIAYGMGVVNRFMSNLGKKHWEAVKGVLQYLNGTKDRCICFGKGKLSVVGYTDADYAGDLDKRRSTSGYLYTFAGGAISWLSRLQSCVTLSTTEAEYVAVSEACKEAIWLTCLVGDLGIVREIPVLHCDSQSAIQLARNLVFHAKTKHVDVRYHFIREVLEDKRLQLVKVHTKDNWHGILCFMQRQNMWMSDTTSSGRYLRTSDYNLSKYIQMTILRIFLRRVFPQSGLHIAGN